MQHILQRLDDLKSKYRAKFLERNGSVFITFRRPDSSRLQKAFMPDDKPKVIPIYKLCQNNMSIIIFTARFCMSMYLAVVYVSHSLF